MAQKIYFNWKDDDKTDWLNRKDLAMLPYGVYRGFDFAAAGTNFKLVHNLSGYEEVTQTLTLKQNLGALKTKQGGIVVEDADITIPLVPNSSPMPRIDLVVVEHEYIEVVGGSPAVYMVIAGTPSATPVAPALTTPNKQLIIGELHVPPFTTTSNQVTFVKATVPLFAGDNTIVRTNNHQRITGQKDINYMTSPIVNSGITYNSANGRLTFPSLSNSYNVPTGIVTGEIKQLVINGITSSVGLANITVIFDDDVVIDLTSAIRDMGAIGADKVTIKATTITTFAVSLVIGIAFLKEGGEALKYGYNAFERMNSEKKVNKVLGSTEVHLGIGVEANTYVVDTVNTSLPNASLMSLQEVREGTVVRLQAKGTKKIHLQHNWNSTTISPVPVGYKPLFCVKDDINSLAYPELVMTQGDVVTLIEEATHWRVINVFVADKNPLVLSKKITDLEAHTKVEGWKEMWDGVNPTRQLMDNLQPAPLFQYPTIAGSEGAKLRKVYSTNAVEIEFYVSVNIATSSHTPVLFTLPLGYRPAFIKYITGFIIGTSAVTPINIAVNTNGTVIANIPTSFTGLVNMSLSTSFNL